MSCVNYSSGYFVYYWFFLSAITKYTTTVNEHSMGGLTLLVQSFRIGIEPSAKVLNSIIALSIHHKMAL